MKKMILTGLTALMAACSTQKAPEKGPETLNEQTIIAFEDAYRGMDADGKRSRAEAKQIYTTRDILNKTPLDKKADAVAKEHLGRAQKTYNGGANDVFSNMDVYFIAGGVSSSEMGFENAPENFGAVRAVYVGKGSAVAEYVSVAQRDELVSKARDAWAAYKVTQGHVKAGGGRVQDWEYSTVEVSQAVANAIVGNSIKTSDGIGASVPGQMRITKEVWAKYTDGKDANGEMKKFYLSAIMPSSYELPKVEAKADKK